MSHFFFRLINNLNQRLYKDTLRLLFHQTYFLRQYIPTIYLLKSFFSYHHKTHKLSSGTLKRSLKSKKVDGGIKVLFNFSPLDFLVEINPILEDLAHHHYL